MTPLIVAKMLSDAMAITLAFVVAFAVYALTRAIYTSVSARYGRGAWLEWEGTIISAVLMAEKCRGCAGHVKHNVAYNLVSSEYSRQEGHEPSKRMEHALREGIHIKHAELFHAEPVATRIKEAVAGLRELIEPKRD